ncbi:MAG: hypothetical protein EDR02_16065 [Actinobacteria bacterium]|nr:MAG: hypothetical protein EDR02_16065 [Actinomycetota bacterium]RIK03765.1 MAG: hypothetical protein DCC48_15675 [Acidobacteriota bacterium]
MSDPNSRDVRGERPPVACTVEVMRTVTATCRLMSHTVGDVPNEKPGRWDGTGDWLLKREIQVEDDSRAEDVDWGHVCERGSDPLTALDTLKDLGYRDPLE